MSDKGSGCERHDSQGRWLPGVSGIPAGRPKGARNKATLMAQWMLEEDGEGVGRSVVALAKAGDLRAIRLCLDRLYPRPRDRHVAFDLPPIETEADVGRALAALMRAVAEGELTPSEAASLAGLAERAARALARERERD